MPFLQFWWLLRVPVYVNSHRFTWEAGPLSPSLLIHGGRGETEPHQICLWTIRLTVFTGEKNALERARVFGGGNIFGDHGLLHSPLLQEGPPPPPPPQRMHRPGPSQVGASSVFVCRMQPFLCVGLLPSYTIWVFRAEPRTTRRRTDPWITLRIIIITSRPEVSHWVLEPNPSHLKIECSKWRYC